MTEEQEEKLFKIDEEPEPLWTPENDPCSCTFNGESIPNEFPKSAPSTIETDSNVPLPQDQLDEEKSNTEEENGYIWVM